jgi:hypothetical protein
MLRCCCVARGAQFDAYTFPTWPTLSRKVVASVPNEDPLRKSTPNPLLGRLDMRKMFLRGKPCRCSASRNTVPNIPGIRTSVRTTSTLCLRTIFKASRPLPASRISTEHLRLISRERPNRKSRLSSTSKSVFMAFPPSQWRSIVSRSTRGGKCTFIY